MSRHESGRLCRTLVLIACLFEPIEVDLLRHAFISAGPLGSDFWRFAPLPYRILAIAGIFFVVIMTFLIFRLDRSKHAHLS